MTGSSTSLMDIPLRSTVELERIDAPDDEVEPLLERGILPGCVLRLVRNSPAGDPIISVEGTLLALRRECAAQLFVREVEPVAAGESSVTASESSVAASESSVAASESPGEILATRTA